MKPMGTITKYYPFIDAESKSILSSLMEDSSSFYDFVQRLCKAVLENEAPENLAYIAAVQAWWVRSVNSMKLIQEKYGDVPCIRPWGFVHRTAESDQIKSHDAVVESIDRAIESSLEGWMETELHLLHAFFHYPYYRDIPNLLEPVEKAEKLIATNPLLNCYEPLLDVFKGHIAAREGNAREALLVYERGRELAEKYDDTLYKYMNLCRSANILKSIDIQRSLALFEEIYVLVQDMDVPFLTAEILIDYALVLETMGEYDLAIASHLDSIQVGGLVDVTCLNMSRVYSTLGDGQEALSWVDRAFDCTATPEFQTLYLRKAWALVLLKKLKEAEQNLDTAYPYVMKLGSDMWLSEYYWTLGILEIARGDYLAALDVLEKALNIAQQHPRGITQNIVLLHLAQAEFAIEKASRTDAMNFIPGMWFNRLEEYAREKNLQGIRMQAELLKAEFYRNYGQLRDAYETLQQALVISDSPGVKTLRMRIKAKMREIDQLMRDEEMAS
jgi:tetratricopeptide (TPR) repeat protein